VLPVFCASYIVANYDRYDKWKADGGGKMSENRTLTSMSHLLAASTHYSMSNPRQKELLNGIVNHLILSGNLPLSIVEQPWFMKFMNVVDPKFHLPNRRKITSMITGIYDSKRQALKIKLESADTVSLTLDLWSDRRM